MTHIKVRQSADDWRVANFDQLDFGSESDDCFDWCVSEERRRLLIKLQTDGRYIERDVGLIGKTIKL